MASGRSEKELQGVTMLGHKTDYPTDYAPQVLEAFDNKHPDNDYFVKFNCPEFTSLCPMTGMGQVYASRWLIYRSIRKLWQAWYRVGKDCKRAPSFPRHAARARSISLIIWHTNI